MERIYQLPIDIRILIALSNPQTASLMYVYDPEFRKYVTEPAFVQPFMQFVLIIRFNNEVCEHVLNNRRLRHSTISLGSPFHINSNKYIQWYLNGSPYRFDIPGLIHKKKYYAKLSVDST